MHDLLRLTDDLRSTLAVVHLFGAHNALVLEVICERKFHAELRLGHRGAYASAVRCMENALPLRWRNIRVQSPGRLIIAAVGDHALRLAPGELRKNLPQGRDSSD
jgi:hypothetical protein